MFIELTTATDQIERSKKYVLNDASLMLCSPATKTRSPGQRSPIEEAHAPSSSTNDPSSEDEL